MTTFTCRKKCCEVEILPYNGFKQFRKKLINNFNTRLKAGIFLYDPKTSKVLLVQSRGHLWGLPKGTLNTGEDFLECAIREVQEETGLIIPLSNLDRYISIKGKARYYYVETDECKVSVQTEDKNNDANGIGWINIDCLKELIQTGQITLNKHCVCVFSKFLDINDIG